MGRGEREGERGLSLVSPSSLLCLGSALCVCFSFFLSLCVSVIQCVVSLLKNSPLSYHFCFFLLVQHSPYLGLSFVPFFALRQYDWFTFYNSTHFAISFCCSSPSPSACFYYNASIYFFLSFFSAQLQLLFCCFTIC